MPFVSVFPMPKSNGRPRIIPYPQAAKCLMEKTVSLVMLVHWVSTSTTILYLILDRTMIVKNDESAKIVYNIR